MATKRPFDELGPDKPDNANGEYATGHSYNKAGSSNKRQKHNANSKHESKEDNLTWMKRRVRDIERLLRKDQDLPANVQNNLERELAAHQSTIVDKGFQKRRSRMISKYHMVRFFERKKATRLVKQLRRKLEESSNDEDTAKRRHELHIAEVDEAYTLYHPHAEPYVSLYGSSKGEDDDDESGKVPAAVSALQDKRPQMWSVIEQTMEEGPEAMKRLRERRSSEDGAAKERPRKAARTAATKEGTPVSNKVPYEKKPTINGNAKDKDDGQSQLNRRERRQLLHRNKPALKNNDSGDDDDAGGFFEEG